MKYKTRRVPRKRVSIPTPLASSYGTVILPKGTKLYHISYNPLCNISPQKPFLFTTLHPSEYMMIPDTFIATIETQRDIKLLFMISAIYRLRIFSALANFYSGMTNNVALKQNTSKLETWLPTLQQEGFDGWFTSIESKSTVECAIQSDPSLLKIVGCSPNKLDWRNLKYSKDMSIIPKQWGTTYSISSLEKPITLLLNSRFKPMLEAYQEQIAEEDPRGTVLSILLENATISYFDAPVETIRW